MDGRKGQPEKRNGEAGRSEDYPQNFKIDYRDLVERVPAVFYITALDETGGRLYISPQIEAMLGFPLAQWFTDSQLWLKQIYPEDRRRVLGEFYKSHRNGLPFSSEYRLIASDGRIVWVRDEANVVKDNTGAPCYIEGVLFDISETLRTKEMAQKSEAKFRTVFEEIAVGIALINREGRIMESNRALQKMLGYRGEELFNRVFNDFIHPDDITTDLDLYEKLLEGKQDHYQVEKRYLRKGGSVLWGRLNVSLICGLNGEPQSTVHMVEDITEWKQLETQFLQAQKMETVGRLAGGIAHDLNNLFTVLSGYSQLSLMRLKEDDPLTENLREIKKTTDRAAELTNRLLAISRRQALDMMVIDLNQLVRGLEKMLGRIIGEDIELIIRPAGEIGKVKTDPNQMEQVILNLVVNARDAMPNGGKLVIEIRNVELDETYAQSHFSVVPGRFVLLSVTDTGCGMSPEVKERIFDPFFTTKTKGKGTGLGLSTVYGIIKQSGGNIWVYSEPGQGTTFKIYLPRVEEEADEISPREEGIDFPRGNETILFVEDEDSLRGFSARVLRGQGYTVLEAANGDEAMELARRSMGQPIHLLLTDLVMPQMGGKQLVEQFKILHPDARILFISGYTDEAITRQTSLNPDAPFLQKPFSPLELTRKIREVLDSSPGSFST